MNKENLKKLMQTEQFIELKEYIQNKIDSSLDLSLIFPDGIIMKNEIAGEQAKVQYGVYKVLKALLEDFEDIENEKNLSTKEDVERKFGLD